MQRSDSIGLKGLFLRPRHWLIRFRLGKIGPVKERIDGSISMHCQVIIPSLCQELGVSVWRNGIIPKR
jgi:hypothetical protein